MTKIQIALAAAALTVPMLAVNLPALAASAHNLQSGAHTSNTYDTVESAALKQQKQQGQSFWNGAH